MNQKIPLFEIFWDDDDLAAVHKVIASGNSWACGEVIEEFERGLASYCGTRYAVAVNSGTSALHILLAAHGIGQGDEVIVPSFTFIATANAALFVGAKPVFADIEASNFGLDPSAVEAAITPRTRVVLPIHFAGYPCQIEKLSRLARERGLLLIEDAAESLGASVGGKKVGTFGQSSILSFCQNKLITSGEGGAIITDSAEIFEKAKLLRSHGRPDNVNYFSTTSQLDYVSLGYNFRMSSLTGALGLSQLKKIDRLIDLRRSRASQLTLQLREIDGLVVPHLDEREFSVYQMYPVLIPAGKTARDGLKHFLAERDIQSKVYFDPVHLTQFYRRSFGYSEGLLPATEKISEQILSLPIFPTLSDGQIDYLVETIKEFAGRGELARSTLPAAG